MTLLEKMTLAETLAAQLGIGKAELYSRIGINTSQWSRWRSGETSPRYKHAVALDAEIQRMTSRWETLGLDTSTQGSE